MVKKMINKTNKFPKRGEIWLSKNSERIKELGKDYRPVLIISIDEQNEFDDKIVVAPLTTEEVDKVNQTDPYFIKSTAAIFSCFFMKSWRLKLYHTLLMLSAAEAQTRLKYTQY